MITWGVFRDGDKRGYTVYCSECRETFGISYEVCDRMDIVDAASGAHECTTKLTNNYNEEDKNGLPTNSKTGS